MIQLRIKKLENEADSLRKRFRIVFVFLSLMAALNIAFLFPGQLAIVQKKINDFTSVTQTNFVQAEIPKVANSDYQVSINSFYNNTAITDIGSSLNIKKNSLSTVDTTNCSTPSLPELANGCGFQIRPFATGIELTGTKFMNIVISAIRNSTDKIAVDIIDSETREITSTIGVIQGSFKELTLPLPSILKQNQQILVRLWPAKDSNITLEGVTFEYLDINKLQPVEIKFDPVDSTRLAGKEAEIYLDKDKNGIFDNDIDQLWSCNTDFPGVKKVAIQAESIKLIRDSECITSEVPSNWRSDSGNNSLAPYYYLLVSKNGAKTEVFPLQVVKGVGNYNLIAN